MKEYLYNHNYVSENKKSNYQQELSVERAECIINKHNSLIQEEKQQLIKFLKSKIKEIDNEIKIKQLTQQGNLGLLQEIHELRIISLIYQEVLDFVNKGGKDE